jgi:hypothetical protein
MLVLGLILILFSAAALVAAMVGGSNNPANFDLGIFNIETNTLGVFLLGAATVLLFVMGLELTRSGVRRATKRRRDAKQLGRRTDELETREAEQHKSTTPDPE